MPKKKTINKKSFQSKVETLIYKIEDLINIMPDQDDTEADSQKICLLNRLKAFEHACNGVEDSDFKK